MFCPVCRDEYRPGFDRCATCDVDLVDSLDAPAAPEAPASVLGGAAPTRVRMAEFCGFLELAEAREAWGQLRREGIQSELAIRVSAEGPDREEYWLRVDASEFKRVDRLLSDAPAEPAGGDFSCSECGHQVSAGESFCPGCGERFEETG